MKSVAFDLDAALTSDDTREGYKENPFNLFLSEKAQVHGPADLNIIITNGRNLLTYAFSTGETDNYSLPVIAPWLHDDNGSYDRVVAPPYDPNFKGQSTLLLEDII